MKKISVIIPAYNTVTFVEKCLRSVLSQTFRNIEIILVDDCSTDGSENICARYAEAYDNIIYIRNKVNCGVSFARNVGIRHTKGDFIAFLDSDDYWYPWHIEESVAVLELQEHKICSALWDENLGEKKIYFGNKNQLTWFGNDLKNKFDITLEDKLWKFNDSFYEYILTTGFYCFHINTIVFDKLILNDIDLFNENLRVCEDLEFLYRVFSRYPLATINRPHFMYNYGIDNLHAFIGQDTDYENYSYKTKQRVIQNLEYEVSFYEMLISESNESSFNFNNPGLVKNSICNNIVTRCLTIMLLSNEGDEKFDYYHMKAQEFAQNEQLQFILKHRNKKTVIPRYVCLG